MAVYVDNYRAKFGRMTMCHMVADTLDELHAMADRIGVSRRWFQGARTPHYDVCLSKRELALKAGAILCDRRKIAEFVVAWRKQAQQTDPNK